MCFFGDGTTNIGSFHEALNLAAVWKLPVVFVCENNLYMEYTPIGSVTAVENPAADRASAYGLEPIIVDGNDADAVHAVATTAVDRARGGEGPSLIEAKTYRHGGHSRADPAKYRPPGELEAWLERDPITVYRDGSIADGVATEALDGDRTRGAVEHVDLATEEAKAGPFPDGSTLETELWAGGRSVVAELTYREAVARGIAQEMERDPTRRVPRRGRRGRRRRVQDHRRACWSGSARARAGHADLGAGDHRRDHGRGDEGPAAGRRDHVQRLLRGVLGPRREPDREDAAT